VLQTETTTSRNIFAEYISSSSDYIQPPVSSYKLEQTSVTIFKIFSQHIWHPAAFRGYTWQKHPFDFIHSRISIWIHAVLILCGASSCPQRHKMTRGRRHQPARHVCISHVHLPRQDTGHRETISWRPEQTPPKQTITITPSDVIERTEPCLTPNFSLKNCERQDSHLI